MTLGLDMSSSLFALLSRISELKREHFRPRMGRCRFDAWSKALILPHLYAEEGPRRANPGHGCIFGAFYLECPVSAAELGCSSIAIISRTPQPVVLGAHLSATADLFLSPNSNGCDSFLKRLAAKIHPEHIRMGDTAATMQYILFLVTAKPHIFSLIDVIKILFSVRSWLALGEAHNCWIAESIKSRP